MNYQDEYQKFEKIFDKIFSDNAVVNILNEPKFVDDPYPFLVSKANKLTDYEHFSTNVLKMLNDTKINAMKNYIGSRESVFFMSNNINIPYDVVYKGSIGAYATEDKRFVIDELKPNINLPLEESVDSLFLELLQTHGSRMNELNLMKIKKHIIIQYLIQTKYIHMIPDDYVLTIKLEQYLCTTSYHKMLDELESIL